MSMRKTLLGASVASSHDVAFTCTFKREIIFSHYLPSSHSSLRARPYNERVFSAESATCKTAPVSEESMAWAKVLDFTDPFLCQTAIHAADVELYPTSSGAFQAELTQIRFNR